MANRTEFRIGRKSVSKQHLIRRSVERWSPLKLGASVLAWWDADQLDLITLSGNKVTSWKDRIGLYDAVQSTDAARPVWSKTSFNGAPGVNFDGIDDFLRVTPVPVSFPVGADPSEIWAVVDQTALSADTNNRIIVSYGGNFPARRNWQRSVVSGVNRADMQIQGLSSTPVGDFSGRHVVRGVVTSSGGYGILNDVSGPVVSITPVTDIVNITIGGSNGTTPSNPWKGQIRDIIVTLPLTDLQAADLSMYLQKRRAGMRV